MLNQAQLEALLQDIESDRSERKESLSDRDKIGEAICAFSNDMPDNKQPGYLFVGAKDGDGSPSGFPVTDRVLQTLASFRSDGRIRPLPVLSVQKIRLFDEEMAVVCVQPSDLPPVRYKGNCFIRVGPRTTIASAQEERILSEKRISAAKTFDCQPCMEASVEDIDLDKFQKEYLPQAVSRDAILKNERTPKEQLTSLRFFDISRDVPTNGGIIILGYDPRYHVPGGYIQFVRYSGTELSDDTTDEKEISGNIFTQLSQIDNLLPIHIHSYRTTTDVFNHKDVSDYPKEAIRELVFNAIMHRNYDSNSPIRINWFVDRIEIQNPGGLYGEVNPDNYQKMTDYRNPFIAEALKNLGYVEKYGVGIARVISLLKENGNPPPEFIFEDNFVSVTIRKK